MGDPHLAIFDHPLGSDVHLNGSFERHIVQVIDQITWLLLGASQLTNPALQEPEGLKQILHNGWRF
jgi:hypothetical protein